MKKLKKLLAGVLTLAMAMSMMTMAAFAKEGDSTLLPTFSGDGTGSITIHKYEKGDNFNEENHSTGDVIDPVPGAGDALNGVDFTIYRVADATGLKKLYQPDSSALPTAADYVTGNAVAEGVTLYEIKDGETSLTEKTKDGGIATFSDLPIGLYLVIESSHPNYVTSPAAPFLVSIPMTKADGSGWLYNVHVYPKNDTSTSGTLTLIKEGKTIGSGLGNVKLANVEFILERKNDEGVFEKLPEITNTDGSTTPLVLKTGDGSEGKTLGQFTVEGLPDGEYQFREKNIGTAMTGTDEAGNAHNANAGYILDSETVYPFKIEGGKFKAVEGTVGTIAEDGSTYTLTVENERPDIDKKVKDGDGWSVYEDYGVGDTIEYKIEVGVPSKITKMKTFNVIDTPTNLDDDVASIKMTYGASNTTVPAELYTKEAVNSTSGNGFKITFKPKLMEELAGEVIVITYEAKIKEDAVEITNTNKAKVEYSHKTFPEDDTDPDPSIDERETTATTASYMLKVIKTFNPALDDDLKAQLEGGVTFDLYKKDSSGTITSADIPGLPDGTWKRVKSDLATDADGEVIQKGLSNGDYCLVETKTLPGYNLLDKPVEIGIAIECTTTTVITTTEKLDAEGNVVSTSTKKEVIVTPGKGGTATEDGTWGQDIVNQSGFTLPSTGGMGTFLFTFVGVAMMAAAVILFITSKKKEAK